MQIENDPENPNKLGMQMQNLKSIFTGNKSPAIFATNSSENIDLLWHGDRSIFITISKKKNYPVNEHEKLTWGEGEEKDRGLLDRLE